MPDNVELIESLWDAFGRGDLEKVAGGLAEGGEVIFPASLPWGGSYEGPDAFGGVLAEVVGSFAEFKAKPEMVLGADDDHVVVVANIRVRSKTGGRAESRVVWLYRLRDGKIVRAEAFPDTAAFLEALG
jgi:ketosteroid isomerase-like protein